MEYLAPGSGGGAELLAPVPGGGVGADGPSPDSAGELIEPSCGDTTAVPGATAAEAGGEEQAPGLLLRLLRRQEIAFAAVGAGNTLLGMALTVFWLKVLGSDWPPAVSVVLAYCLSILAAFVAHRTLVFRVRGHLWRDFGRFIVVNSGGLLLNTVGVQLAVGTFDLPATPATVVVMGLVAVASYFGHRYFSFRRAPEPAAEGDR
ncbi:GtrA family protein [Nocardia sp. BMG111209]|uniref:GtrA family protein n=1 Tax=Nocardia sp. BMG111209 TaxID=1160137 RepID=UPI00039BBF56|nr:GtrA family protein [Nocardia sp. BMG111209]